MNEENIQTWTSNIHGFHDYRMRVLINANRKTVEDAHAPQKPASFLILGDSIGTFVSALRTYEVDWRLTAASSPQYQVAIQMFPERKEQSVPVKLQASLLEHFCHLRGPGQSCAMSRNVDNALAARVKSSMTRHVFWFRERVLTLRQVVLEHKAAGDRLYLSGYTEAAFKSYRKAYNILIGPFDAIVNVSRKEDESLRINLGHLSLALTLSVAWTALLAGPEEKDPSKRTVLLNSVRNAKFLPSADLQFIKHRSHTFSALVLCMMTACMALGMTEPISALQASEWADFSNSFHRPGLELVLSWARLGAEDRKSSLESKLKKIIPMLPTEPIEVEVLETPSVCASIDQERYVLRALEYDGDILEDTVVQKQGCFVMNGKEVQGTHNKKAARRLIRDFETRLAQQRRQGSRPELWVESLFGSEG